MSQKAEGHPRLNELEEFIKHGSRGETLELPYDSAVELVAEIRVAFKEWLASGAEPLELELIEEICNALDAQTSDDKGEPPCSNSDPT